MSQRAWPFEGKPDLEDRIRTPQDFASKRGNDSEAIVIRIGLNDAQLVLVDGRGRWERWVYHSVEEAQEVAESLGLTVHVGEYPEATRVRINSYQRPSQDFDRGAYPEQGQVGPVIPYPENRPRTPKPLPEESPKKN